MNMELSLGHRAELRVDQRVALETRQTQLRLELISALHDRQYQPDNQCPSCSHKMTLLEILHGFNDDPLDRTTECPKCHARFNCALVTYTAAARLELAFYCPSQTLHFLGEMAGAELMTPEEIEKAAPAYYHSAIAHFGSLKSAFEKTGAEYLFRETPTEAVVKARLQPFFGKLTDKIIAEVAGLAASKIRAWRREAGIKARGRKKAI